MSGAPNLPAKPMRRCRTPNCRQPIDGRSGGLCLDCRVEGPPRSTAPLSVDTAAFLRELTALSRRHGLGIGGEPILFLMESGSSGDYERTYTLTERSEVEFR